MYQAWYELYKIHVSYIKPHGLFSTQVWKFKKIVKCTSTLISLLTLADFNTGSP